MASVNCATDEFSGSPVSARSIRSSASSGSRKKSPDIETRAKRPASTSTSTATSLPPGTLYSPRMRPIVCRSEEHTSELQSRGHLVCRLLLEKKKKESNQVKSICNKKGN